MTAELAASLQRLAEALPATFDAVPVRVIAGDLRMLLDSLAEAQRERDQAISMLAEWCVAVDANGTGWDDWDEHYKAAMYRPSPLREKLDAAIAEARAYTG